MQQNLTVGVPMYSQLSAATNTAVTADTTDTTITASAASAVSAAFIADTLNTASAASASLAASAANAANSLQTHKVKHGRKFEKKRQIERKNSFFGVLHDTLLI